MYKRLHFKTNTLLKDLVGKDLINDDNIAIIELVKNAYDAKSNSVCIEFENFTEKGVTDPESSRIIISDSGCGMNEADISEKWLNIAYSEKKVTKQKEGSFLAGNKGVGRFSCDRLGSYLNMLTKVRGGKILHLRIDWKDFEVENNKDLTIQKINVYMDQVDADKAKKISGMKMPAKGTVLVISKLRSSWNRDKLLDLKIYLEKFINPNQLFLRKKFEIELLAKDLIGEDEGKEYHDQVNGKVQNLIFENLKFNSTFIDSSIDPEGAFINTELYHDGEVVFRIKEKNDKYPRLKNVHTVIYYLNPYKKAYFKRQTGVRLVDFGSVFLFLNGFRVSPYGDRGDDWLGLDVRKTQGVSRYLGSRDVVGRIEIVGSEEDFKPISSREGLKNTDAVVELKESFFLDVLRRLERFVVDGLDWDSVPEQVKQLLRKEEGLDWNVTSERYAQSWDRKKKRISLSIMSLIGTTQERVVKFWFNPGLLEGVFEQRSEEVSQLISEVVGFNKEVVDKNLSRNLKKIGKLIAEKEEVARLAKREIVDLKAKREQQKEKIKSLEKKTETFQQQTLFLQSISSLDEKQLLSFHHQICLDSNIIDNYIAKVIKALRSGGTSQETLKNLEKISRANKRIMATAQYATKANFKSGVKRESTDIPSFFEQYIENVAKDFVASGINITINNSVSEPFELKAKRIELSILIDNLISNSDKANSKNLSINIVKVSKNALQISFVDDGQGLDDSITDIDKVFDLGVTTTSGSGIGLYHVKQIVDSLDGEISLIRNPKKGVEIRMVITR